MWNATFKPLKDTCRLQKYLKGFFQANKKETVANLFLPKEYSCFDVQLEQTKETHRLENLQYKSNILEAQDLTPKRRREPKQLFADLGRVF
jgi:hypothetical protein